MATFFIGRDADNEGAELPSARAIKEVRADIAALHQEVLTMRASMSGPES